jgi:hypothetical protein
VGPLLHSSSRWARAKSASRWGSSLRSGSGTGRTVRRRVGRIRRRTVRRLFRRNTQRFGAPPRLIAGRTRHSTGSRRPPHRKCRGDRCWPSCRPGGGLGAQCQRPRGRAHEELPASPSSLGAPATVTRVQSWLPRELRSPTIIRSILLGHTGDFPKLKTVQFWGEVRCGYAVRHRWGVGGCRKEFSYA